MDSKRLLVRLYERLREFRTARSANVTITFAFAMIPVMGAVGAAVDYSHVNSARTAMQSAVDATALMLSKEAAKLTPAQLGAKATTYFTTLYTRPEITNISVFPNYTTAGGTQIVLQASGTMKASFVSLLGVENIQIGASSTVKWGNSRLRVALALDTTGSMSSDGKMAALKTATKNLLTQLKNAAAKDGDVYVSIVPFSKDVNAGASNSVATWIDWTDWNAANGTCSKSWYKSKNSCTSNGGTWTPMNHNTWNGCVTDRGLSSGPSLGNYDTNVVAPSIGNTATLFPAEEYNSCSEAVMALNYDWTAMNGLVDKMSPKGMTNQAIGLAHGWMSLVGGGPYPTPPVEDPKYKYSKVIILMSDGLNTDNRWDMSESSIDARQKMTCDNVKAAGITLYTIHVNTGGDPMSKLLQGCASDLTKFFHLTKADALVSTFNQIGTALSNLYVAK